MKNKTVSFDPDPLQRMIIQSHKRYYLLEGLIVPVSQTIPAAIPPLQLPTLNHTSRSCEVQERSFNNLSI